MTPNMYYLHSFKTRPDGSTRDPADPGLELSRVEEKTGKEKTLCDPVLKPETRALDWAGSKNYDYLCLKPDV